MEIQEAWCSCTPEELDLPLGTKHQIQVRLKLSFQMGRFQLTEWMVELMVDFGTKIALMFQPGSRWGMSDVRVFAESECLLLALALASTVS